MRRLSSAASVALIALATSVIPRATLAAPISTPTVIEIMSARVHLHDLGIAGAATPDVDLGLTPPLGSTRTIDRDEIARALAAVHAPLPAKLPAQVRVVRKARRLASADVDRLVRASVEPTRLPKGATITAVRSTPIEVPDGFDHVVVELPQFPRRAGPVTVRAAVAFEAEGDILARVTVPVEITVPAEALVPDVAKGAAIMLIVRHGLVEVSIGAIAGSDGDAGGVLPVLLKPSGRIVRARILDKDHAVAIEDT